MPTPEQSLSELVEFLDMTIDGFAEDIPKIQDQTFKKVQSLLKDLDLLRGNVKASAKNLRKINRIKRDIENLVLSPRYKKNIGILGDAFNKTTELQSSYFNTLKSDFTTPDFINTLRDASIQNTKVALTQSGIRANVVDKAGDLIQQSISEGASFSDMIDVMRNFLTETPTGAGALKRYTSQIVTDSLNTYAAEYNRFVSDNLDLKWFIYSGSLIKTSRSFCISLIKKKWVHKSEFGKVAHGNFIPRPRDLKGLKPGTNAKTLQIKRGGYACRHLLTPIAEEFVPKKIRDKFAKGTEEKKVPTPPPTVTPKVKPKVLKGFKPAKTITEAEQRIRQAGVNRVDLKGLKPDQFNSVLKSMEAQAEYSNLNLEGLVTFRKPKSAFLAIYSPSNNSIGINLSSLKRMKVEGGLKSFKIQIEGWKNSKASWERHLLQLKDSKANPRTIARASRKATSRINSIERDIKRLEEKVARGESPKHWSIGSSQKNNSDYLSATMTHEMGHYRDYQKLRKAKDRDFYHFDKRRSVSQYGEVNKEEYFAESYTAYFHGNRGDIPKELLKIFDSWK